MQDRLAGSAQGWPPRLTGWLLLIESRTASSTVLGMGPLVCAPSWPAADSAAKSAWAWTSDLRDIALPRSIARAAKPISTVASRANRMA